MSNQPSSQQQSSQQPKPNIFIGPGNTNLGPGPVIPDSIPAVTSTSQSSAQQTQPHNAFTGPGGIHLGHGPRVDHLPKNEDGTFRLGSGEQSTGQSQDGQQQCGPEDRNGQGGQTNPWRGPGGMRLGHGPRVDHLPKNEDGTFRLNQPSDQGPSGGN